MTLVGVADQEVHANDTFAVHVLDGIAAAASDAYHFDDGGVLSCAVIGSEINFICHILDFFNSTTILITSPVKLLIILP